MDSTLDRIATELFDKAYDECTIVEQEAVNERIGETNEVA